MLTVLLEPPAALRKAERDAQKGKVQSSSDKSSLAFQGGDFLLMLRLNCRTKFGLCLSRSLLVILSLALWSTIDSIRSAEPDLDIYEIQQWFCPTRSVRRTLVTLADMGLSRRMPEPPESPLLSTRCGSEDYAAEV